ncbi:tudor domain-containing protein 7A-like isoform X2 [Cylas formicarius]|uniref:tudor domain-containing protein 7A-like isoform X2 n=1 Tax=Cylas formicarius TaxID=197179 RepID=UPI00295888AD|nr:tudor domain-containing protein 7A-like isoform X2 [Cylas formicarius]
MNYIYYLSTIYQRVNRRLFSVSGKYLAKSSAKTARPIINIRCIVGLRILLRSLIFFRFLARFRRIDGVPYTYLTSTMDTFREEVIKCIRGCLISTKEMVSLKQLNNDYYTLIGERIPYQKLGFKKLEDFIQSSNELELTKRGTEYFVCAVPDKKSSHIIKLVSKQKTSSKRRLPTHRVRFHLPQQQAPRFANGRHPTSNWRPKSNAGLWNNYKEPARPRSVAHSQFINHSFNKSNSVESKVVIPDYSSLNIQINTPIYTSFDRDSKQQGAKKDIQGRLGVSKVKDVHTSNDSEKNSNQQRKQSVSDGIPSVPTTPTFEESSQQVGSARQRISRMMSEITLGRDSGNSSPVSDTSPPSPCKVPEFVRTDNPFADLEAFAALYQLGEVEVREVKIKGNQIMFSCKIKIGKHTYSSYPKDFSNEKGAKNFCCEVALSDLLPKYHRRKSLLISCEVDVLERIPPILEKHNNGIWAKQLKLDYADRYKEQLPDDWLQIVDSSPLVQIEAVSDDHILQYCKSGVKGQRRGIGMTIYNVSVPSKTVEFGEDGKLIGQITYVMSANEIWCQQIQTKEFEQYLGMMGRMELYYSSREDNLKAFNIVASGYYVAKVDGCYFRVRAVSVTDNEVNCFCIDYGDEVMVHKTDIFELKREYATTQAQAFVCRLAGLEELYEISVNSELLADLVNMQVILELAEACSDRENVIPVVMYEVETGNFISGNLIPKLTMESALPVLHKEGITEVYVSHIESHDEIYVQTQNYGFEHFNKIREALETDISTRIGDRLEPVTQINSNNKLYFARSKSDGHWYRIKLIDWSPRGDFAKIHYIDRGDADIIQVAVEKLYPLDRLSDVLCQYPPQAVRVRMVLEEVPDDFAELAGKHMPPDQAILLKVLGEDDVPPVEFFKRSEDGGLFCINKSIAMDMELRKEDSKSKMKISQFKSKCVPSAGTLAAPALTQVGELFEVHIPIAVNPYNFFIQPLASKNQLDEMMVKLQKKYNSAKHARLSAEEIVPGQIYASRHEDDVWYRTSVIKVIHARSISVFFCDFGYYRNLVVEQLVPLDEEFLELPYQALKAKLSNIKPKQNKWTMEDCEVFKMLVEKKDLYSLLIKIEKDVLYESDFVLELVLIDTKTEEDVYIDKELVRQNIAVKV